VIKRGWFLRGKKVAAFEEEWAAFCGQRYCVACNSVTEALTLAIKALEYLVAKYRLIQGCSRLLVRCRLALVPLANVAEDGRLMDEDSTVPVLLYGPAKRNGSQCILFDAAHVHGWRPPDYAVAC
jgi:DegT/DnrJ/EryC1/StrS aminotransferase family